MLKISESPVGGTSSLSWKRRILRTFRWKLPTTVKPHRILSGPLKGMKIVTSWRDYPAAIAGITERPLLEWFSRNAKAGDTWLDIGAHYGYTAMGLSRCVGPKGRVFAFEPMLTTIGSLSRTRVLNDLQNLTVVPMAVGAVDTFEMQRTQTIRGMIDQTLASEADNDWYETIGICRLDWLWDRISGPDRKIAGVKIDVQGMEIAVLRGMLELLKTQRPLLVVELHRGVDRAEFLSLLASIGYSAPAEPIEPVEGETTAQFVDDRSYGFRPSP